MSRADEIRAEWNARADKRKPFFEAQAARIQKTIEEGRQAEVIASMYDGDAQRKFDRDLLDRYDKGLTPGDMDLITMTIDEYMASIRKRLEEDDY